MTIRAKECTALPSPPSTFMYRKVQQKAMMICHAMYRLLLDAARPAHGRQQAKDAPSALQVPPSTMSREARSASIQRYFTLQVYKRRFHVRQKKKMSTRPTTSRPARRARARGAIQKCTKIDDKKIDDVPFMYDAAMPSCLFMRNGKVFFLMMIPCG